MTAEKPNALRLIDLHTDWLLQYAPETTLFDAALYSAVPQRLGQSEGYLHTTSAAVLACYRKVEDWSAQASPWSALGDLITRLEAEFSGRLLIGPHDFQRWQAEPQGNSLAWGVIGVEGFDAVIRSSGDLARLPQLFERGVRLFQPVYSERNVLAGSSVPGDDRGLVDLGRAFLETLADVVRESPGPRAMLDLAHLNPRAAGDVLGWFEANPSTRLIPVYSHGALGHEAYTKPRAITLENLGRLRALGGVIGFGVSPPFYTDPAALRAGIETAAALPYLGQPGYDGIAIGTDFLGVDRTLPGLANAPEVVAWFQSTFDPATAARLVQGNAHRLLATTLGIEP